MTHSWQKKGSKELAANPSYIWACEDQQVLQPLTQVSEVEQVFMDLEGQVCSVMIVVPRRDDAVLGKIFDCELQVIDSCPTLDFDFTVISRDGRALTDLVTPTSEAVFTRP